MDDKVFIENPESAYHEGIMIDKYRGTWSIIAARKSKNDKVYMMWGYPQKGKEREPLERAVPWGVKLGNRKQAIAILERFLDVVKQGKSQNGEQPPF